MPEILLRHEMDCTEDTYWDKCIFDEEYNRRLFIDTLKFPGFTLLASTDDADKKTKKARIDPPVVGIPGPVKKAIGDRLSYVEDGVYDKKTRRYRCVITPSTFADKTKVSAELWCETLGEKRIARSVKVSVEVKVFMLGSMVEEKIMQDLKHSYEQAAIFTNAYCKEKGY
jgi:hypothetical protein